MSLVEERIERDGPIALRDPTPEECEIFLEDVRSGTDPSTAARKIPCAWHPTGFRTSSMFGRFTARSEVFSIAYGEALAERAALKSDQAELKMEEWAFEERAAPAIRLSWAAAWNVRFRRSVGMTGKDAALPLEKGGTIPDIDPNLLSDDQLEQLRTLLLIAAGRVPNPELEREALAAGEGEVV